MCLGPKRPSRTLNAVPQVLCECLPEEHIKSKTGGLHECPSRDTLNDNFRGSFAPGEALVELIQREKSNVSICGRNT